MKDFFKTYRSNSFAGTCNQHCFFDEETNVRTGRIFYKISFGGTNDTWRNYPTEGILRDIETIVDTLKKAGVKVILQTIPPFNYHPSHVERWKQMNEHIMTVLRDKVELVFDEGLYLRESEERSHYNKYGAHPNEEGSTVWAKELYAAIKAAKLL